MPGSPIHFQLRFNMSPPRPLNRWPVFLPMPPASSSIWARSSVGNIVQVLLTVQPNAAGAFTNSVVVADPGTIYVTSTNAVVNVSNQVVLADSAVTIIGPGQAVVTNDFMTYGVTVSNLGPSDAPNVILTNTLPPGVFPFRPPTRRLSTWAP